MYYNKYVHVCRTKFVYRSAVGSPSLSAPHRGRLFSQVSPSHKHVRS